MGRERQAETLLCALGIYRPTRKLYQYFFNRRYRDQRRERVRFLREFIRDGDLVLDISAHVGEYVDLFLDCGADVVAVEPHPGLAELLRRRFRVPVEAVAVGAERGTATLFLGTSLGHSTVSTAYRDSPPTAVTFSGAMCQVPVTTLDDLIDRYGEPGFIKIDVEGSEAGVLAGLHRPFGALSFEFHLEHLPAAAEALQHLPDGELRAVLADSHDLHRRSTPDEVLGLLQTWATGDATRFGDIYLRRCESGKAGNASVR